MLQRSYALYPESSSGFMRYNTIYRLLSCIMAKNPQNSYQIIIFTLQKRIAASRSLAFHAALHKVTSAVVERRCRFSQQASSRRMQRKEYSMTLNSIASKIQKWRQYRASVRELSRLSDRELNDLGIGRADIEYVARKGARDRS